MLPIELNKVEVNKEQPTVLNLDDSEIDGMDVLESFDEI
jgi:hypothetical protein